MQLVEAFRRLHQCTPKYRNTWALANDWRKVLIKQMGAWATREGENTARKFRIAMNKVAAFGGYQAMRDYKTGNLRGVFAQKCHYTDNNKKEIRMTVDHPCGLKDTPFPVEPPHNYLTPVDILTICFSPRTRAAAEFVTLIPVRPELVHTSFKYHST